MATRIQFRRDTAANWTSVNPTLQSGELGFESNTGKFKIGNGSSSWTALSYASILPSDIGELSQDAVNSALTMGEGILKNYDDNANTLTLYVDSNSVQTVVSDTHSNFVADTTTIYDEGVLLFETDTQKFKFGNSVDIYDDLYFAALNTQGGNMQGNIDMQLNKVIHLSSPVDDEDAATKEYVDDLVANSIFTHNSDTSNVHGIANTADLATTEIGRAHV